jgi:hypothetical protein
MSERVVWLVYSRAMQYRRTKHGARTPPLREDEHAYRVVLPPIRLESRQIVTVHAERVA